MDVVEQEAEARQQAVTIPTNVVKEPSREKPTAAALFSGSSNPGRLDAIVSNRTSLTHVGMWPKSKQEVHSEEDGSMFRMLEERPHHSGLPFKH